MDELLDLSCYILTSARGLMDEPKEYCSLRILEIFSRLITILDKYGLSNEFLKKERDKIDREKEKVTESEEKFREFLDNIILEFTEELMKKEGV